MYGLCIASLDMLGDMKITGIYVYESEQECLRKYAHFLYDYLRHEHPYKDEVVINNRFNLEGLELIVESLDNSCSFVYTIDCLE